MAENQTKYMSKFKDMVFIIMFLATLSGWIYTGVSGKVTQEMTTAQHEKTIEEVKIQLTKINDKLTKQAQINGKVLQYIEMDMKD